MRLKYFIWFCDCMVFGKGLLWSWYLKNWLSKKEIKLLKTKLLFTTHCNFQIKSWGHFRLCKKSYVARYKHVIVLNVIEFSKKRLLHFYIRKDKRRLQKTKIFSFSKCSYFPEITVGINGAIFYSVEWRRL